MFPKCGKILVIDDQIEEAMPLLNILGKRGLAAQYYSGDQEKLPDHPFNSIRLVFCDLRFYATTQVRDVVSNIYGILSRLIAADNGPYILVAWSAHSPEYLAAVKESLQKAAFRPEFILGLNKSDYFDEEYDSGHIDEIKRLVDALAMDVAQKDALISKLDSFQEGKLHLVPKGDALDNIGKKLEEELKEAKLFYLFLLWENAIGSSALQTVNSIYSQIPPDIRFDKRIQAMLFYLSHFRLEKQFDTADVSEKFSAAMVSLNKLFSYFYEENVQALKPEDIWIEDIPFEDIKGLSEARFNTWKNIGPAALKNSAGNVYIDEQKSFNFHGWINANRVKEKDKYDKLLKSVIENQNISYIYIDVSADCDIAQQKQFVIKTIPGIIVLHTDLKRYEGNELKVVKCAPEYIFCSPVVEIDEKDCYIVFNLNQLNYKNIEFRKDTSAIFSFNQEITATIKQKAANCISKQGY